jgi:uncharacterized protein (DUF4415 family)
MPRKKPSGAASSSDPDDAPTLTAAHLADADVYVGERLLRRSRGRPRTLAPKERVTLRLDADLVRQLRSTGPGWQTRVNLALRAWMKKHVA